MGRPLPAAMLYITWLRPRTPLTKIDSTMHNLGSMSVPSINISMSRSSHWWPIACRQICIYERYYWVGDVEFEPITFSETIWVSCITWNDVHVLALLRSMKVVSLEWEGGGGRGKNGVGCRGGKPEGCGIRKYTILLPDRHVATGEHREGHVPQSFSIEGPTFFLFFLQPFKESLNFSRGGDFPPA